MNPDSSKAYHHGDLRRALVKAALAVLEQGGLEALSLRRVAAELGVSHAAPAHHFPTLRHLRTALATEGFARFGASMAQARARAKADPLAQLRAAEQGYLAYARSQPALFRLMFNRELLDWGDMGLSSVADAAYQQLVQVAAPACLRLGLKRPAERQMVEHLVWSQIHGRAHLMIDGKLTPAAAAKVSQLSWGAWLFGPDALADANPPTPSRPRAKRT
jgi:AcrR family transcriptional regulator